MDQPLLWKSIKERDEQLHPKKKSFSDLLKIKDGANHLVPGDTFFSGNFLSRREFIEWMGGLSAALGLASCTRGPQEDLIPYTKAPEDIIPGKPLFYATSMPYMGNSVGLLVESHMGRPTKIEGNPLHPQSLGGTDPFVQASILSLYDPDRATGILHNGNITYYGNFVQALKERLHLSKAKDGQGFRILTETVISPSLGKLIQDLIKTYPKIEWHQYEPVHSDTLKLGSQYAFGDMYHSYYNLKNADVVVAIDGDFFADEPGHIRYIRDFMSGREVDLETKSIKQLYAIESTPTLIGAISDSKLTLKASDIEGVVASLAYEVGFQGVEKPSTELSSGSSLFIQNIKKELLKNISRSVVMCGRNQPPRVHALCHAINQALKGVGHTVFYSKESVEVQPVIHNDSLKKLVHDMNEGAVESLLMLGGNILYNAPSDLDVATGLKKVQWKAHLTLYQNETSVNCDWVIPETHYLESWGDYRSLDGTVSLNQPLIEPLYNGKSSHDILLACLEKDTSQLENIKNYWKEKINNNKTTFDTTWKKSIHDGYIAHTEFATTTPTLKMNPQWMKSHQTSTSETGLLAGGGEIEFIFKADPTIWDGSYANNGWLQELPKPLTKVTWDNACYLSPTTAKTLGVRSEDVVLLSSGNSHVEAPVFIQPGHPDGAATLHVGYGRTKAGRLGNGMGFNAYKLRTTESVWIHRTGKISPLHRTYKLACTQEHHSMEGREPVRATDLQHFLKNPQFVVEDEGGPKIVHEVDVGVAGGAYAPKAEADYKWGMVINLSTCVGCNACVVACQSENNSPVVGKIEVSRGREMQWIRIDRYYEGAIEDPQVHFQPVNCMHCETAPCELVCPVNATNHDNEGINNMVYNRCVGTKYCSNNCPYKVRRFNFYEYAELSTPTIKMAKNPDVTVRSRGVMEKCTYCVQRISAARITAKNEHRKLKDGDVKTACQTACPSHAITFGDLNDPESQVSKLKKLPMNYGLLAELNTKPRTTYLGKIKNMSIVNNTEGETQHE